MIIYVVVHAEFKNLKEENNRIEIYNNIERAGWVKIIINKNNMLTTWLQCFNVVELSKEVWAKMIGKAEEDFIKCSEEYTNDIVVIASVCQYGVGIEPKPKNIAEIIKHVKEIEGKQPI
jgi:hypothetical protein